MIDVGPGTFNFPQCNFPLGSTYDGEVAKPEPESPCYGDYGEVELPNGRGVLTQPDGITIEGTFVDGRPSGEAHWTDAKSGWNYIGEFVDGKKHGQGILKDPEGSTFVGRFEKNLRIVGSARVRNATYTGPMVGNPLEPCKEVADAMLQPNKEDDKLFAEEKPKEIGPWSEEGAAQSAPDADDLPTQNIDEAQGDGGQSAEAARSPGPSAFPTSPSSPTTPTSPSDSAADEAESSPKPKEETRVLEPVPPPPPPDGFTHGSIVFDDQTQYTGEWVNGWRHGRGWCKWADGREYSGSRAQVPHIATPNPLLMQTTMDCPPAAITHSCMDRLACFLPLTGRRVRWRSSSSTRGRNDFS